MILEHILERLRDARQSATMESAGFGGFIGEHVIPCTENGTPWPSNVRPTPATEFIRERTRLYRGSWIIGPLDSAISTIELHAEMLQRTDALRRALGHSDVNVERIAELVRAGQEVFKWRC